MRKGKKCEGNRIERKAKEKQRTTKIRAGEFYYVDSYSNIIFQKAGANLSSDDNINDSASVERERERVSECVHESVSQRKRKRKERA